MPALQKLWLALEDVPGATASLGEWRDRFGADLSKLQPLLVPTDKFADAIPAPGDPCASYRVVWYSPDDIVGVPEDGGPTIALAKQDLLIYRLDHQRIITSIATALQFDPGPAPLDGVPYAYRIGTFRQIPGFAFPAFVAFALDSDDLRRAVELIASQHDEPFIFLAPTNNRLRPACEAILKRRRACFLALSDAIEVNGRGKWTASEVARRQLAFFQQTVVPQAGAEDVAPAGKRSTRRDKPEAKSWTQPDLNDAIREYKASRASTYRDLVEGVNAGLAGAIKDAQKLFGRNAVARALQVKAPAMVTNSPVWQAIADELRIPRGKDRNRKTSQKVGLDIAIEQQACQTAKSGLDIAVQDETIRLIRKSMSRAEAEPLIERLQRGDITDDDAREIVSVVKDQKRDRRSQQVSGNS